MGTPDELKKEYKIYPEYDLKEFDNRIRIKTLFRKKHNGKYYLFAMISLTENGIEEALKLVEEYYKRIMYVEQGSEFAKMTGKYHVLDDNQND